MRGRRRIGRRLTLWALALFVPLSLLADGERPLSPAEVLERAKLGRNELLDAVTDVGRFVPDLRRSEDLFPYLGILDELERVASRYDFKSTGIDPVKTFAGQLTTYGAKWIELERTPWATVEIFFRRAEDATRYTAASIQVKRLNPTEGAEALLRWHAAIADTVDLNRRLGAAAFVVEKLEELETAVVRKLLKLSPGLPVAALQRALERTRTLAPLGELVAYLSDEMHRAETLERVRTLMDWTGRVAKSVAELGAMATESLLASPGRILLEGHARLVSLGGGLGDEAADAFVDTLRPAQLAELADSFAAFPAEKPTPAGSAEYLWRVLRRVATRLPPGDRYPRRLELERYLQRLAGERLLRQGDFQGSYDVEIGEAPAVRRGVLTVATVGASNFSMGLGILYSAQTGNFGVDFNFFDVVYDAKTDEFIAQYRAVEWPKYLIRVEDHHHLRFRFTRGQDGKFHVAARFFDGRSPFRYRPLTGVQREGYPSFPAQPMAAGAGDSFVGRYEADADGRHFELMVTKTGSSVAGKLAWDGFRDGIAFELGYFDEHTSALFLTSGEARQFGKWMHLRGQLSADGSRLRATYIVSGQGIRYELDLRRVEALR